MFDGWHKHINLGKETVSSGCDGSGSGLNQSTLCQSIPILTGDTADCLGIQLTLTGDTADWGYNYQLIEFQTFNTCYGIQLLYICIFNSYMF
jgi:hypothetical protein